MLSEKPLLPGTFVCVWSTIVVKVSSSSWNGEALQAEGALYRGLVAYFQKLNSDFRYAVWQSSLACLPQLLTLWGIMKA